MKVQSLSIDCDVEFCEELRSIARSIVKGRRDLIGG